MLVWGLYVWLYAGVANKSFSGCQHQSRLKRTRQQASSRLSKWTDAYAGLALGNQTQSLHLNKHLFWAHRFGNYILIVFQRHKVRIIPVTEARYSYDSHDGIFYVYGFEQKAHAPDYPSTCCGCCCTILWMFKHNYHSQLCWLAALKKHICVIMPQRLYIPNMYSSIVYCKCCARRLLWGKRYLGHTQWILKVAVWR